MIRSADARTLPRRSAPEVGAQGGFEEGLKLTLAYFKEVFEKR